MIAFSARMSPIRKGIAKELLTSLCKYNQPVNAWVIANTNAEAGAFYAKIGFSQEGPYNFLHGIISA